MKFVLVLPKIARDHSILVVLDGFSKMNHFIPCSKTIDAFDVVKLFLNYKITWFTFYPSVRCQVC